MEPIRISDEVCGSCKYRGLMDGKLSCNYASITGHSRIFEGGQMAFPPNMCNKYDEGPMIDTRKEIYIFGSEIDEYESYKINKITKERGTYAYKEKEKHKRRGRGYQGRDV